MLTNGLALLIISTALGIDQSWERGPDGQMVYSIQVEEVLAKPLAAGQAVKVHVEEKDRGELRHFKITIGQSRADEAEAGELLKSDVVVHGWRPGEKGGIDYMIQLHPERLEALADGIPVVGTFDSQVHDIRSIYVFSGTSQLPRQYAASGFKSQGKKPRASLYRYDKLQSLSNRGLTTTGDVKRPAPAASSKPRTIAANYTARELAILAALDQVIELEFADTPLRQVLDAVSSQHEIPIVLDTRELQAANIKPDTSVTVSLKGIPLDSALQLTLSELQLAHVVKADVLYITTQDIAEQLMQVRVYDVSPLLESDSADELLDAVAAANPTNQGSTIYGDHLIVREAFRAQQEIWRLLRALAGEQPKVTPGSD